MNSCSLLSLKISEKSPDLSVPASQVSWTPQDQCFIPEYGQVKRNVWLRNLAVTVQALTLLNCFAASLKIAPYLCPTPKD